MLAMLAMLHALKVCVLHAGGQELPMSHDNNKVPRDCALVLRQGWLVLFRAHKPSMKV